jgi:hypothetical protein
MAEPPRKTSRSEIDAFIRKATTTPKPGAGGRLIFAMDATASREPTWDHACQIQGEMFEATTGLGGLEIQLCYYRGYGEFQATAWLASSRALLGQMGAVRCRGGHTQIEKVLRHTLKEATARKVDALVFVGDCMEEDADRLCHVAGALGLRGVPAFMFHEGFEPAAERTFRQIARLSRGAYCRFDSGSARELRDLLSAVAVYASGGRRALEDLNRRGSAVLRRLTDQLDRR